MQTKLEWNERIQEIWTYNCMYLIVEYNMQIMWNANIFGQDQFYKNIEKQNKNKKEKDKTKL